MGSIYVSSIKTGRSTPIFMPRQETTREQLFRLLESNGRGLQQETTWPCQRSFWNRHSDDLKASAYYLHYLHEFKVTITRLYQAQDAATVRLLLTGITECMNLAIHQLPFRRFIRIWCHPDVDSAILKLMSGFRHEVTCGTFFASIATAVRDLPNYSLNSIKGMGSTKFHIPGQRSKEGDEGIKCQTRAGRDNWPNFMLEVGCPESLPQLRVAVK